MKRTVFTAAVALLIALPACFHSHGGGPGRGTGRHGDCQKSRCADCPCPQGRQASKPDCPNTADCPKRVDCPKSADCPQGQPAPAQQ